MLSDIPWDKVGAVAAVAAVVVALPPMLTALRDLKHRKPEGEGDVIDATSITPRSPTRRRLVGLLVGGACAVLLYQYGCAPSPTPPENEVRWNSLRDAIEALPSTLERRENSE